MSDRLAQRRCVPQRPGSSLPAPQAGALLDQLRGWCIEDDHLVRHFAFTDFHRTMAFVNAVAWIAHAEDHHPELVVTHASCTVRYRTHSADGLTVNDFICAARIEALRS